MKSLFGLVTACLILLRCNTLTSSVGNTPQSGYGESNSGTLNQAYRPIDPTGLLNITDAEKILGEKSRLTDSTSSRGNEVSEYKSTYTANSTDKIGRAGAVYFLFEQYIHADSAKKTYSSIKMSNRDHRGFKELNNLGEEALFHSDDQNFYLIIVRKGLRMFRIKVNKITSTTSLAEFNEISRKITASM